MHQDGAEDFFGPISFYKGNPHGKRPDGGCSVETPLLNFSASSIQQLMKSRNWESLDPYLRIRHIYDFVRDEILFGYNADDNLPASAVLSDGYGQCNTKGTLLMALFRGPGIPCRIHGFTVDKQLQKGAMTGIVYQSAPREIVHSCSGSTQPVQGLSVDTAWLSRIVAVPLSISTTTTPTSRVRRLAGILAFMIARMIF